MDGNLHKGHRQRVKRRFLTSGLDGFEDHNVLELLLFFGIPQSDVNETAHHLLNQFGSFHAVFDAPIEALMKVPGIGEHTATLIRLVGDINRRCMISKTKEENGGNGKAIFINSIDEAGRYLIPYFHGARSEMVYILLLDAKHKLIDCKKISHGEVNATYLSSRKVVEEALLGNATDVILAHNHTSGLALPSNEDIYTTHKIEKALNGIGIQLVDHLIIADGDFVSMRQSNLF